MSKYLHQVSLLTRTPIEHYWHERSPLYYQGRMAGVPPHVAYYCRVCGTIWAKDEMLEDESKWLVQYSKCPEHGIGSLYSPHLQGKQQSWYDLVPVGVLLYELDVAIKCFVNHIEYWRERMNAGWE